MGSTAVPVQLWVVSGDDSTEEEEEEYLVFTLFCSELSNGPVLLCWNTWETYKITLICSLFIV